VRNRTQSSRVLCADALLVPLQGGRTLLALAEGEKWQVLSPGPPRTGPCDGYRQPCGVQRHSVLEPGGMQRPASALPGVAKATHRLHRPRRRAPCASC